MKTLCITGISEPDLLQLGAVFHQAGVSPPRSNERSPGLNIKQWHDRFGGEDQEGGPDENRLLPGKFGEQLAAEIFFANMEVPLWGWHDSRSTWLLDFWAEFDPRLVFILVCFPPDYLLARRMETQASKPLCVDEVVAFWKDFHEQLLQFYHRFPERCLLVDVDDSSTQFEALADACHAKWNLPLDVASEVLHKPFSSPDPLFRHLAGDFLCDQPEASSLWNELKATLTSFSSPDKVSLQFSDIVASLHALGDRSREERQIAALKQKNRDLQKTLEASLLEHQGTEKKWNSEFNSLKETNADLIASKDNLAKQVEQRQGQINSLTQERDKLKADLADHVQKFNFLETQQRETGEENELLLLQLHQVQEELESIFLQRQDAEKKWNSERSQLKKINADLTASKNSLTRQTEQRQGQINTLTQERNTLKKNIADLTASKDSLVRQTEQRQAQINTLSQERDTLKKINTDLTASRDNLAKEVEQQQGQINSLTQERNTLKTNLADHVQKMDSLETQQRETGEENELLLLQLHQVQEELESIFLQKLENEKKWNTEREQLEKENTDQVQARWQRLQQRYPGYHDYHSLTVAQGDQPSTLVWQISNLEIGPRFFSNLEFETFLLGGVSGFRFTKLGEDNASRTSPLLRRPQEMADAGQIDLIPVAENPDDVQGRIKILKGLTTSDWNLLPTLAFFLKTRLEDRGLNADLPPSLRKAMVTGLDRFIAVIKNFPASLRYDDIALEKETCTEDCEWLDLVIENMSHGELQSSQFKFRLSCAGLQSSDFGSHPRLEFAADANPILKSWFDSSDNPENPRMELRFAMPDAMDLDVWGKLSRADAQFILMLVRHLPQMIDALRRSDSDLNRSWDQWVSLSNDVEQILQLRTAPTDPEEAA